MKTATVKLNNECRYFTTSSHAALGINAATLVRDASFYEGWYEIDVPADFDVEDAAAIVAAIEDGFTIPGVNSVTSDEGPITNVTVLNDGDNTFLTHNFLPSQELPYLHSLGLMDADCSRSILRVEGGTKVS